MAGVSGAGGPGEFAELLREFKERSGLSYGVLAKRLHMSTSTLHRYCNGTVVPNEYAPVERLARVCGATPQELVELHRLWILADATRGQKPERSAAAERPAVEHPAGGRPAAERPAGERPAAERAGPVPAQGQVEPAQDPQSGPQPDLQSGPGPDPAPEALRAEGDRNNTSGPASSPGPSGSSNSADSTNSSDPGESEEPLLTHTVPGAAPDRATRPRRRNALIAAAAVATVLGVVALITLPSSDEDGKEAAGRQATEVSEMPSSFQDGKKPSGPPSASAPSASERGRERSKSAPSSTSPSASDRGRTGPEGRSGSGSEADSGGPAAEGTPLSVATRPFVYESPCSQHFLVDSDPEQVGPPASEQDAPRWAAANGAVSSGEQRIALTVQGSGKETVVLEALHVRVISKGAPLAWNDYSMGVGCGGGVETKSFDVDLDQGSPTVNVKNGQRDFPYKVSESDPEVFYVTARAKAHDVRWDLTLDWSSGDRRGTLRIDNAGVPFRTSGDVGRPGYDYPLGGSEWIERVDG